jgi:hypothetical protein
MERLQISHEDLRALHLGSYDARVRALGALQSDVKRRWKKVARELHPDRHPGDAEKEEEFKIVGGVVDELMAFEIPLPPPRRVQQRLVSIPMGMSYYGFEGSGSSTTTAVTMNGPVVQVIIRRG